MAITLWIGVGKNLEDGKTHDQNMSELVKKLYHANLSLYVVELARTMVENRETVMSSSSFFNI